MQTSSGNAENLKLWFGSPLRDPFFDPTPLFFGFWSTLWQPLGYINLPTVVLSCSDKYAYFIAEPW